MVLAAPVFLMVNARPAGADQHSAILGVDDLQHQQHRSRSRHNKLSQATFKLLGSGLPD